MKKIVSLLICTFIITILAIPCYATANAPEVNITFPDDNLSVGEEFIAYVTVQSDNLKSFNITPKDISVHGDAIDFTEIKKIDEKTIKITGDCVSVLSGYFVIAEGVAVSNDGAISAETFSNIFIDNGEDIINTELVDLFNGIALLIFGFCLTYGLMQLKPFVRR